MFLPIFFWYCAAVILGTGVLAVCLRNPIHSVLSVLVLFFHLAALYLLLQAEFLAAVQIIVYAGAILVLYLFVLFLVDLRKEMELSPFVPTAWLGAAFAGALFLMLLWALRSFTPGEGGEWASGALAEIGNTRALGVELFTKYLLPFEIAGVILLVALIGGLILAVRDSGPARDNQPNQPVSQISQQNSGTEGP